ncbi:MAG: FGGY family carbohydrate kinase [Planctomycetota bacterium]
MIQFLGVHLGTEASSVAIIARDLTLSARASARVLRAERDPSGPAFEVPPAEWVRAGTYAIQEAYFQLEAGARKPWGLGLSGPRGWIALDVEYEPLSPLRILPEGEEPPAAGAPEAEGDPPSRLLADILGWFERNPRARRRACVILSPKDYFRFAVSGALAADVTDASRLGLLSPGASDWSDEAVERRGLDRRWLPPVFDSHLPTGRISEEGMRATSLPGGSWVVAGANEEEARLVSSGDARGRALWVAAAQAPGRATYAYSIPHAESVRAPRGWRVVRSALAGYSVLSRTAEPEAGPEEGAAFRRSLEGAGYEVSGVEDLGGSAEEGAALLAAHGSGLVRNWTRYGK